MKKALEPFWTDIGLSFIFGSVARGERAAQSDVGRDIYYLNKPFFDLLTR